MIQRATLLLSVLALMALPARALAQDDDTEIDMTEPEPTGEDPAPTEDPGTATDPDTEIDMTEPGAEGDGAGAKKKGDDDLALGETRASWQDIIVVKRKPFLKMNRMELVPSWAITLNDNMIRHYELNGQLNYYLTDVLAVGVEGQFFVKDFMETYDLIARQDRRLPTLNKYNFGAALDFHYVPIYAKFAIMNKKIIHWEAFFTAGVGFTQSEVIPRDPALPGWTNFLITPNVGFTMRFFVTKWITVNIGVKDYIFVDKYENVDRSPADSLDTAQEDATPGFVNHVLFQAGVSFWFPTSFRYTTFR